MKAKLVGSRGSRYLYSGRWYQRFNGMLQNRFGDSAPRSGVSNEPQIHFGHHLQRVIKRGVPDALITSWEHLAGLRLGRLRRVQVFHHRYPGDHPVLPASSDYSA